MPPAPAPTAAPAPAPPRLKAVTFCPHCEYHPTCPPDADPDVRYHSDPGRRDDRQKTKKKKPKERCDTSDGDLKYYSEPDADNYFEIDYEFLKELRRIARNNCPKCKRKRARRDGATAGRDRCRSKGKDVHESYVYCNGRYHSVVEHCQLCCKTCSRSTDTLASVDEDLYSRSYGASTPRSQSSKSVSFLQSSTSTDGSASVEPNYTAKSFTNDLKRFLLKPSPPRVSLRDKFISSIKQELEATKRSPKLKAIKGLWKSY